MKPNTYTLNSEELFTDLENSAEEKAEAVFKFVRSDKYEKILIAELKAEIKKMHDKISQVELTDLAYRHPKYKKWLDDYSKKAKNKVLTSDKYNNRVALKDMRITEESSARYLIKKGWLNKPLFYRLI